MAEISEIKQSSEVYDILNKCINDELKNIVDVLVKYPTCMLNMTREFEQFYPDHSKYSDNIGDEIYRLSVMALGRSDGIRPSYHEMLLGLCKQIGIPAASNDIIESESILLNTFTKQHLSSLPFGERQCLVDDASMAASTAAKGILSSDAWPPFASVLLQLAYLRRKLVEEQRLSTEIPDASEGELSRELAHVNDTSDALEIQTENGGKILSLAVLPQDDGRGWRQDFNSRKAINVVAPILKALQPFVSTEQMLKNGNYMRVTLPPCTDLVYSDKLESFIGVARNSQNKFNAVKLDPASLVGLATPAGMMILASAVMEQKKLENIENSLDDIKASVNDLSKFQKSERRAVLTGSIRYFRQVAPSVFAGELANEVLHEIERHEVELSRVQEHYIADIQGQISVLRSIKNQSIISNKNFINAIQEAWTVLNGMYDEALLCVRARACGYQLLCAYPGREAGKKARLDDIHKALGIFAPTGEAAIAIDQVLREKVQAISSYETKVLFLTKENALFDKIIAESSAIFEGLRSTALASSKRTEPISIDLKIEGGQVVAIR